MTRRWSLLVPHPAWCHSPVRLPGPNVDWGARRPKLLGEDVHPHLHLSLEWTKMSWLGLANLPPPPSLLSALGMLAWGEVPVPGSRPAEAVSSTKHWGIWEVDGLQIGSRCATHQLPLVSFPGGENMLVLCDGCEAGGCDARVSHVTGV